MLRKFTVENFHSIREPQTLDLTIGRKARDPDGRFVESIPDSGIRLPKVALVFGASASGKTNLLQALDFVLRFIAESASWSTDQPFPFVQFATSQALGSATRFRLEFDAVDLVGTGTAIYEYEVELTQQPRRVCWERLRFRPERRARKLFERVGGKIQTSKEFDVPKRDPVRLRLLEHASVISILAQFAHPLSKAIAAHVRNAGGNLVFRGRFKLTPNDASIYYAKNSKALTGIGEFALRSDLGINEVRLVQNGQALEPIFVHNGLDEPLGYELESRGTQAIYRLYPILHEALSTGSLMLYDELDNDIHPNLLPEILRLFHDAETNPGNAQLIASCHDASALEYLMKEQVYFTEKDSKGRTEIFGLNEFLGVRRDDNFYAKYTDGAYGGVPILG